MKISMPIHLILLFLTLLAGESFGQAKYGTSAAPFLGIPIGPAGQALGGAYVSYGRDATALYWNPGAISRAEKSQVYLSLTDWFLDTKYNWVGVVVNTGYSGTVGLQMAYLDYGEGAVTTVDEPGGTGERWAASDLYTTISYANNLTNNFSIGGSVKVIQQKIFNESATGFAFDIGLLYITRFRGMRLGMSISNFGTKMQMDGKDLDHTYDSDPDHLGNNPTITSKLKTAEWPIPLLFRVGVSMEAIQTESSQLSLAVDAVVPSDNTTIMNLGAEYAFRQVFFLRGGYQSLMRNQIQEGLTMGVGVRYFVPGLSQIQIDYSYMDYGIIDKIQSVGFGVEF